MRASMNKERNRVTQGIYRPKCAGKWKEPTQCRQVNHAEGDTQSNLSSEKCSSSVDILECMVLAMYIGTFPHSFIRFIPSSEHRMDEKDARLRTQTEIEEIHRKWMNKNVVQVNRRPRIIPRWPHASIRIMLQIQVYFSSSNNVRGKFYTWIKIGVAWGRLQW